MSVDDLASQEVGASATMVLTHFPGYSDFKTKMVNKISNAVFIGIRHKT